MYIELHRNSASGEKVYRTVFDLGEINDLTLTTITTPAIITGKNTGKYESTNASTIESFVSTYNLPIYDNDDGNILPASIFPTAYENEWVYACYEEDPDAFEQVPMGTEPSDFQTSTNYCFQTYWSAPGSHIYHQQIPTLYSSNGGEWSASRQYWKDLNYQLSGSFYAGNMSFWCSKWIDCDVGWYNNTKAHLQWGQKVIPGGYNNTSSISTDAPDNVALSYMGVRIVTSNNERMSDATSLRSATGELEGDVGVPASMFFIKCSKNNIDYIGIGILQREFSSQGSTYTRLSLKVIEAELWGDVIHEGDPPEPVEEDWVNGGLPSGISGGDGTFDYPSDNTGDKDGTTETARATLWNNSVNTFTPGYNKYKISTAAPQPLLEMFQQLWNPNIWQGFANKFMNPIQSIISCHIMPQNLVDSYDGTAEEIHAGGVTLSEGYNATTFKDFYRVYHVGSYDFGKATASFADYDNTSIYIHLPYIGVKQIDTTAVQHGSISIDYAADSLTGDVIAFITCFDRYNNSRQRYSFKGNCARNLPLVQKVPPSTLIGTSLIGAGAGALFGMGGVMAGEIASYLSGAGGLGAAASMGFEGLGEAMVFDKNLFAKAGSSALKTGIGTSLGQAIMAGQQLTTSNAEGGGVSTPIDTSCFLIISRPMWSNPLKYSKQFGYPSDISGTINASDTTSSSKFVGFLAVRSIKLDGIAATDDEIAEIDQLMKAGVYLGEPEQE